MLSQQEVYEIMEKDILNLQRKRIAELEYALLSSNKVMLDCDCSNVEKAWLIFNASKNQKLVEKGISL